MSQTITRALTLGAASLALAGAAYAGTAVGHAGPYSDQAFTEVLHERGIGHDTSGDAGLILAGHETCNNLRTGRSINAQIDAVYRLSGLGQADSRYFVGASIAAYCPEYM